jgi:hypothetical protein
MPSDGKLYVRASCSICRGREGMFCVYCDEQGMHFIEASEKTIIRWFSDLTGESKESILRCLQEEKPDD